MHVDARRKATQESFSWRERYLFIRLKCTANTLTSIAEHQSLAEFTVNAIVVFENKYSSRDKRDDKLIDRDT